MSVTLGELVKDAAIANLNEDMRELNELLKSFPEEVRKQIITSCASLEKALDVVPDHFERKYLDAISRAIDLAEVLDEKATTLDKKAEGIAEMLDKKAEGIAEVLDKKAEDITEMMDKKAKDLERESRSLKEDMIGRFQQDMTGAKHEMRQASKACKDNSDELREMRGSYSLISTSALVIIPMFTVLITALVVVWNLR